MKSHISWNRSVLAGAALLAAGFAVAQAQNPPASPMHHEMPKPHNLQVLPKDISGPDLIKLMHGYSAQLGEHCSYCHAEDPATHRMDFASDANPEKATARIMIVMTDTINAKYLTQIKMEDAPTVSKVECGTCHRGQAMPSAFVASSEHGHQP